MKVKYLLLSLMGVLALSASAQNTTTPEAQNQKAARKTVFRRSAGHWFLTLQGGASAQFLSSNETQNILKRVRVMPTISLGQWHTPYFATRLQVLGGPTPTFYKDQSGEVQTVHSATLGAHFDFMFDIVNFFAKYRENRVFHLTPWVGLGYNYKYKSDFSKFDVDHMFGFNKATDRHTLTANVGITMNLHLAKYFDLVLEAQAAHTNMNLIKKIWDNDYEYTSYTDNQHRYNGLLGVVSAGIQFNMGEQEFEIVTPMDMNMIRDLNQQINILRTENIELSKRPVSCPECPEIKEPQEVKEMILGHQWIYFEFDKSRITKDQMLRVKEVADYINITGKSVRLIAYCDVRGTVNYNIGLAERRARSVAKALTEKFGISSDKISIEWRGKTDQFETYALNRVVIVTSK